METRIFSLCYGALQGVYAENYNVMSDLYGYHG